MRPRERSGLECAEVCGNVGSAPSDDCVEYPATLPMVDKICMQVDGQCASAKGTFATAAACPKNDALIGCCRTTEPTTGQPYPFTCYYKSATTTPASIQSTIDKCNMPDNKVKKAWEPGPAAM